ncbi:MAG: hypothetical protein Q9225_007727 [Loekoesia sp. 1 TL-2023]
MAKHDLGDATASISEKRVKTDDAREGTTRRGARSKNLSVPDETASKRGTLSAKRQGKKISKDNIVKEVLIPMTEKPPNAEDYERVVFIDEETKQPLIQLYRKGEKAEPMALLWADFLREIQGARGHIGLDVLGSSLTEDEEKSIDLKNNSPIFPTLITSKGGLRSKDNLEASTAAASRNEGGVFSRASATVTPSKVLHGRALSLRKKAQALMKQADAYERAAAAAEENGEEDVDLEEDPMAKLGMSYIGEVLSLSRKEFNTYVLDHEQHLAVTAEKLRNEMTKLAAYCNRAEKRLRDLIQLKVAADLKLCRDIAQFGKFEIATWQMEALPTGAHICQCLKCRPDTSWSSFRFSDIAHFKYPNAFPEVRREDALPIIKTEESEDPVQTAGMSGNPVTTSVPPQDLTSDGETGYSMAHRKGIRPEFVIKIEESEDPVQMAEISGEPATAKAFPDPSNSNSSDSIAPVSGEMDSVATNQDGKD